MARPLQPSVGMDAYTFDREHGSPADRAPWVEDPPAPTSPPKPMHGAAGPGPLTRERERELLTAYAQTNDAGALAELVRAHLPLVRSVVRRHRLRVLQDDDLVAEGTLGLIEAARRFDPSYEVRFASYAVHWVRAKVQEHAIRFRRVVGPPDTRASRRILGRRGRVEAELRSALGRAATDAELAAALGVGVEELEEVRASYDARDVFLDADGDGVTALRSVGDGGSVEDLVADEEERLVRRRALARAMGALPARERDIIERRRLSYEPAPLHVLATEMSLSRERVRQLELRALSTLGRAMSASRDGAPPRMRARELERSAAAA